MPAVFSYEECRDLVEDFARAVPALLARHPSTADLALELEKLNLSAVLSEKFSVAMVGQMRVGKSTLLNSLIGRDLAPTGVTETTATVNWFRQDPGGLADVFRVHDDQGGEEDLPLSRVGEWLGKGERARHTRRLDFFADSPFLRVANLIDTPGLRSVIATHQNATMSFLEERLEEDSLALSGRADAVIYALNPVARETDSDMLALFGSKTRLPGSAVWNSLAVVQKWELLDPDPLEEAAKKCSRLARQLEGKVAAVIPTSGLLSRLADTAPEWAWERVSVLAKSSEETLGDILESPEFFLDDIPRVPVTVEERRQLRDILPWPALRLTLKTAQTRGWRNSEDVLHGVREASGIGALKALLERRFFALSSLIKVGSTLRKAWAPCQTAMLRLRHLEQERRQTLELGHHVAEFLRQQSDVSAFTPAVAYVDKSLAAVEAESKLAGEIQVHLEAYLYSARDNFATLESDVQALDLLERLEPDILAPETHRTFCRLFGVDGPEPRHRLGIGNADAATMLNAAEELLAECQLKWQSARGVLGEIYELATERLEKVADYLFDAIEKGKS